MDGDSDLTFTSTKKEAKNEMKTHLGVKYALQNGLQVRESRGNERDWVSITPEDV
jgi:hypothetical protein